MNSELKFNSEINNSSSKLKKNESELFNTNIIKNEFNFMNENKISNKNTLKSPLRINVLKKMANIHKYNHKNILASNYVSNKDPDNKKENNLSESSFKKSSHNSFDVYNNIYFNNKQNKKKSVKSSYNRISSINEKSKNLFNASENHFSIFEQEKIRTQIPLDLNLTEIKTKTPKKNINNDFNLLVVNKDICDLDTKTNFQFEENRNFSRSKSKKKASDISKKISKKFDEEKFTDSTESLKNNEDTDNEINIMNNETTFQNKVENTKEDIYCSKNIFKQMFLK